MGFFALVGFFIMAMAAFAVAGLVLTFVVSFIGYLIELFL